jgi:uncharacterized protein (DUF2345 family)
LIDDAARHSGSALGQADRRDAQLGEQNERDGGENRTGENGVDSLL